MMGILCVSGTLGEEGGSDEGMVSKDSLISMNEEGKDEKDTHRPKKYNRNAEISTNPRIKSNKIRASTTPSEQIENIFYQFIFL
jgi:hypothetical protein